MTKDDLIKITDYIWEIPRTFRYDMRVPARIYADQKMLEEIFTDRSLDQLINLASLPGVQDYVFVMPDCHEGYGSPIGGVFASRISDGIISPGAIGYDINCGMRLLASRLDLNEIKPFLDQLATEIFNHVPSGVGRGGRFKLDKISMDKVLNQGAPRLVEIGYGTKEDIEYCESNGCLPQADASKVLEHAKKRGRDQLGTLGSGNHFLEIQRVEKIYDQEAAKIFGLVKEGITIMIHCGSRGLGHQVCTDYVRLMLPKLEEYKIVLPDRELACAPFSSKQGQAYFAAMAAAANFAWANRQMISCLIREAWLNVLKNEFSKEKLFLAMIYDVAHNIGKIEEYQGEKAIIHRKGATRAFGPGHPEIPRAYQEAGQPVIIPGTMGTASYVLTGTKQAEKQTFGTICHGAGRTMSRAAAKRVVRGSELRQQLRKQGIIIYCESDAGLAEEAPIAYKDVDRVVDVVEKAGLAKKVARLRPIAVVKGG